MKNTTRLLAAGLGLALFSSAAQALDFKQMDYFAGFRGGKASTGQDVAKLNTQLSNINGATVTASLDNSDMGGAIYAGFALTPTVSLEVSFLALGDYNLRLDGSVTSAAAREEVRQAVRDFGAAGGNGLGIALRMQMPVVSGSRVLFDLRPGVYRATAKLDVTDPGGNYTVESDRNFFLIGMGLSYPIGPVLISAGMNLVPSSDAPISNPFLGAEYRF